VKLAACFKGYLKRHLQAAHPAEFAAVPAKVWWKKWVADIQPVGSGEAALKYLAAYLCRPPLPESQLLASDAEQVTFRYREHGGAVKTVTLAGAEFLRRFLQHVPPRGFQRVRHYGWLGAAASARRERIHALLDWRAPALILPAPTPPPQCPVCRGPMRCVAQLPRAPP
jgi:hypothetical protein